MADHTFDDRFAMPLDDPATYDGVLTRRVLACCLDYTFIALLLIPVGIVVFLLGLLTLGLGWVLFGVIVPLVAIAYVWRTLGGPSQATWGMRAMGIRLLRLDGEALNGPIAVLHSVLFWVGNTLLTPLILLATLFTDRKRTVHDLLLGTVVVRSDPPL